MKNIYFAYSILLIGLTALVGSYGLIFRNGLGMPVSALFGSPFNSYVVPGLLLGFVGLVHVKASILLFINHKLALIGAAVAGFGMMIFEFFEIYIIRQPHFLQTAYFFVGLVIVVVAGLMFRSSSDLAKKHV